MFPLQLNDVNQNPMPAGTKVEMTSMLNANAAAVVAGHRAEHRPAQQQLGGRPERRRVSGAQGSTHTFSISSTTPTGCTGPAQASFNVTVTTPGGYGDQYSV